MNTPRKISVLFVCTGNICRSPTAEALFVHHAREAGMEDRFFVDSAGTHGYHIGDPPDPRAIRTARKYGVDMSSLRARKLAETDFSAFDFLFAMDRGHHAHMRDMARRIGHSSDNLLLYQDFPTAESSFRDVPDPYYGQEKDFEAVYRMLDEGARRLLSYWR